MQATPLSSSRSIPSTIVLTPTKPKEQIDIPSPKGKSPSGNSLSDFFGSEFDEPSTIPETQLPVFHDPTPVATPATLVVQDPNPKQLGSPMRRYIEMIWKPTGDKFTTDMQHFSFKEFLRSIKKMQLMLGSEGFNPDEQGVHYTIGGSKECILTMSDEFEVFKKRLSLTRPDDKIILRPVDFTVSSLQKQTDSDWFANKLSDYRTTSSPRLQTKTQVQYIFLAPFYNRVLNLPR